MAKVGKLTTYNILLAIFGAAGGFAYGFAWACLAASIGQPEFYIYLGLNPKSERTASLLGAVNGLFFTGGAFGSVTQGWVSDKIGRKRALLSASVLALIGTAFIAGTAHIGMLIAFRFVQGWGMGMIVTLAPLYLAEISPPHRRGLVVGAFAFSLGLGTNVVGWVSLGTYYAENKIVQWRLPLALACVAPIGMVIGAFFIPESPRWLIWNGQDEAASQILKRLHKDSSDDTDTAADAEFTQIKRQVELDKQIRVTYWELFRNPSYRKRTLIVITTMFAYQSTGAFGIGNYKVLIYQNLGFSGGMPLLLNALYTLSGTLSIGLASLYMDKTGRRILFLIGFPILAGALLAEALLSRTYVSSGDKAGNAACVFFLFFFIVTLDLTVDPVVFVYSSELWPTPLRSKGMAIAWFTYFVGAITYTAPAAVAFRNIGWKMYMVWVACNTVSFFIVLFYFPETANKTLEEVNEVFGDSVAVHIAQDGKHVKEETEDERNATVVEKAPSGTNVEIESV